MKAESQQIDRILEVFARRYWHCNPKSVFGSADVVYAVTYSMLLLNTDLHVVQGSHSRMTRSAFVRNTMSAAYAQGPGNDRNQGPNATKFPKWWESEMEIYLKVRVKMRGGSYVLLRILNDVLSVCRNCITLSSNDKSSNPGSTNKKATDQRAFWMLQA
jgi:hypothetical protein